MTRVERKTGARLGSRLNAGAAATGHSTFSGGRGSAQRSDGASCTGTGTTAASTDGAAAAFVDEVEFHQQSRHTGCGAAGRSIQTGSQCSRSSDRKQEDNSENYAKCLRAGHSETLRFAITDETVPHNTAMHRIGEHQLKVNNSGVLTGVRIKPGTNSTGRRPRKRANGLKFELATFRGLEYPQYPNHWRFAKSCAKPGCALWPTALRF
jgi:hypothetical protein